MQYCLLRVINKNKFHWFDIEIISIYLNGWYLIKYEEQADFKSVVFESVWPRSKKNEADRKPEMGMKIIIQIRNLP